MMMKNYRQQTQHANAAGNRRLLQSWCRVILLGILVILISCVNNGETAEPSPVTISAETEPADRASVEITRQMIEDIVIDFLNATIPWEKNRAKIKLVQISSGLMLPNRPYSFKVVPPHKTRYLGAVPLTIVFDVSGQPSKKATATAKIEVETDVVVVQKPLNRNQTIEKDDVSIIAMDMADLPSNTICSMDEAVGKKTLRAINPKEILRSDIVEQPPVVRRSEVVSIVAESGSIRITAKGEARENGGKGARIKVVNLSSNKEVIARVMDSKTVHVEF